MAENLPRFDDSAKEEVRSRIDIGVVIGRYVSLKAAGANLKGLCPFHKEKSPSFSVNPARGFFHCFGCGKGGDVFTFLTEIEGINFPEALRMLAEEAGVTLPDRASPQRQSDAPGDMPSKPEMLRIHQITANYFYVQMRSSPKAIEYLKGRQLTGETVKEFGIGYAPQGWSGLVSHVKDQSVSPQSLVGCGLAIAKEGSPQPYDRFRDRLMFPICDLSGRTVAFAGRTMDPGGEPKYLNSPETPIYHKSRTLYGLHKTRQAIGVEKSVYIVEGYMDFLSLYQAGIRNIVATCGTALTPEHVQILRRFASRIILLFDGDAAGQKAAQRGALVLAPHPLDVKVLLLPSTDDPDSFVKKHGAEKFRAIALGAMPAQDYVIDKACAEHDPAAPHGKSAIIAMLTPLMQAMTDSIIRQEFVKKLSERLNVRETTILERAKAPVGPAAPVEKVPDQLVVTNYLSTPEGKFVRLIAMYPQLTEQASQHVSPETLSDPLSADLYSTLLQGWRNGEGFDALAHRISDPDKQRMFSLIAVSQPPDNENPEEELAHTMRQIERNFLKRRLGELRKHMTTTPENTALLVQEHMKLAARLSELDKQR